LTVTNNISGKKLQIFSFFLIPNFRLLWILYSFFWVIQRSPNFMCRRFGKHSLFHLQMSCVYRPMKKREYSETSAHKI